MNNSNNNASKGNKITYIFMALDPIFIGTGGYQLGRVDLTIVREPGLGIPKIPGSTLNGITRTYAAMRYDKYPYCAGQGLESNDKSTHCGEPECPICMTFGYIKPGSNNRNNNKKPEAFQGLALFKDLQILLFPVYTIYGPVWITSPLLLSRFGESLQNITISNENTVRSVSKFGDHINLGSIMYKVDPLNHNLLNNYSIPNEIRERIIIVHDNIISQIINDNLEVRTSVSIDPSTGTAKEGALFTYEAIPRATIFWGDVIYKDKSLYKFVDKKVNPQQVVEDGFELIELFGLGGMTSRGFGRLKVLYSHNSGDS